MRAWGRHTHGSPLYAHLVESIAGDPELMRVMGRIEHLPQANLLFGAVHLLLLMGEGPDLAPFYRSLTPDPLPVEDSGDAFRKFVLDHQDEIVDIGNTRYTQTNESRRCVVLLPMVMMAPFDRFHLVDIGTSAGLNLAMDRYRYRLGDLHWGPPESPLELTAEWHGPLPRLHDIEVLRRIGLDLSPVDPTDESARLWLDALIWPEHVERRERLRAAFTVMAGVEIETVAGDALETLAAVLAGLPPGDPAVVVNSFTLIQFSGEQRDRLESIADAARAERPVFRASMEALDKNDDWARLVVNDGFGPREIGQAHPHGEWVELFET